MPLTMNRPRRFNTCMPKLPVLPILIVAVLLAASCAKKVLPPVSLEPAEKFEQANRLFEKKNFDEARRTFEEVKLKDDGQGYAPLAQLRIADSYVREEDPELAVDEYREFLRDYPTHKYASYAQYQIGMVYFNLIKGPERGYGAAVRAIEAFESLNSLYPRNPYRKDVKRRMEQAMEVIADHEFMVGDFYFRKGAYGGAIGRLGPLLEDFPDYGAGDEALYRLAVSHMALGEAEKAREYLAALEGKYPSSPLVEKARKKFMDFPEK